MHARARPRGQQSRRRAWENAVRADQPSIGLPKRASTLSSNTLPVLASLPARYRPGEWLRPRPSWLAWVGLVAGHARRRRRSSSPFSLPERLDRLIMGSRPGGLQPSALDPFSPLTEQSLIGSSHAYRSRTRGRVALAADIALPTPSIADQPIPGMALDPRPGQGAVAGPPGAGGQSGPGSARSRSITGQRGPGHSSLRGRSSVSGCLRIRLATLQISWPAWGPHASPSGPEVFVDPRPAGSLIRRISSALVGGQWDRSGRLSPPPSVTSSDCRNTLRPVIVFTSTSSTDEFVDFGRMGPY